jgi:hypothetical protein
MPKDVGSLYLNAMLGEGVGMLPIPPLTALKRVRTTATGSNLLVGLRTCHPKEQRQR